MQEAWLALKLALNPKHPRPSPLAPRASDQGPHAVSLPKDERSEHSCFAEASLWDFPKVRGTLFWGPYNKDPTILGYYIRVPFGNPLIALKRFRVLVWGVRV